MRFFRRSKIGAVALILLAFPAALVWITMGGKSVEAGLSSGTSIHSHSGITTGGSTLTRPNLTNASIFTLSTSDDTTDFAIATTGLFGKVATSTTLGTVGLYLDAGNVTDDAVRSPRIANYSDGANVGFDLRTGTVDATDNAIVRICAAGDCTLGARGARIALHGNETTSAPGRVTISAGDAVDEIVQINSSFNGNGAIQLNADNTSVIVTRGGNIALATQFGTVTTNTRIVSTAGCAAGYTRITPNYCAANPPIGGTGLTRDTCTAIASPSTSALMLNVRIDNVVITSGSPIAAGRFTQTYSYSDNTCATVISGVISNTHQRLADANAVTILGQYGEFLHPTKVGTNFYFQFVDDTGNVGTSAISIAGYYD